MRRLVFADSSGLIGYLVARDPYHGAAVESVKRILREGGGFLTSNYVFDEIVTRIRRRAGYAEARRVGQAILDSRVITRVYVDEALESEGWRLFAKYADKELSFTDATSMAVMMNRSLREVLTFDRDFENVGFTPLPGSGK